MYIRQPEIVQIINDWQHYLDVQRNYSKHTVLSYSNDLNHFLDFIINYLSQNASLQILASVDVRLMRSWLSERHRNNYSSVSNARALSSVKNFYRYLEKKHAINCHTIFTINSPKKSKSLPKALSKRSPDISKKY